MTKLQYDKIKDSIITVLLIILILFVSMAICFEWVLFIKIFLCAICIVFLIGLVLKLISCIIELVCDYIYDLKLRGRLLESEYKLYQSTEDILTLLTTRLCSTSYMMKYLIIKRLIKLGDIEAIKTKIVLDKCSKFND